MNEMIVKFHCDERGIARSWDEVGELIRCKDCKHWGRKDVYKDGSAMIVCKQGRSIDADGFCHHAERREE